MKKIFIAVAFFNLSIFAHTFLVEKTVGKVMVLKGVSEKWTDVKAGDQLHGDDLISTEQNSSVQVKKDGNIFILKGNSALTLNGIKKISLNDLLLALTMEEVKSIPSKNQKNKMQTTAVYGAEQNSKKTSSVNSNIGLKKLNGAKQLAESGFKESAILVSRETFRKYKETQKMIPERIYFCSLYEDLGLYDEARTEYMRMYQLSASREEKEIINSLLKAIEGK